MNVKQITRALHTLSLLSEEDYDLVLKLRALTEDERGMLMTVLEPSKPATKKASKKSSKSPRSETERVFKRCDTCGLTKRADVHKDSELGGYHEFIEKKSPRASGMAAQLKSRVSEQREAATKDNDEDGPRCIYLMGDDAPCTQTEHSLIHRKDGGYLHWHEFQPGKSTAPPAPAPSPANGGVGSTTQSLEASAASAQAATGGSGE